MSSLSAAVSPVSQPNTALHKLSNKEVLKQSALHRKIGATISLQPNASARGRLRRLILGPRARARSTIAAGCCRRSRIARGGRRRRCGWRRRLVM
ncbi:uncharacterized protein BP01DRAFT_142416 [Aspergillus saccharolyticus JOP 1030-1]|uniref:Uncharacterized protein n=1 Tax=Aspergillus saccharolyticus JOP 1030-1 TaxID=1450539 RepID=A0A318ZPD7_9EURO|nr:hypothetical protein BP01DRAFT_142416 [Aspergillus saccharolyticus JOP 1030-1]PYH41978.1 hypothetical protein BP01DRAFT_142416 [Aspergillus saccharolyticus JOP 1030-1]